MSSQEKFSINPLNNKKYKLPNSIEESFKKGILNLFKSNPLYLIVKKIIIVADS